VIGDTQLSVVVWKSLFGEDLERLPDPNKPENVPRIDAERKLKVDAFKNFAEGVGKPLFDQWQLEVRGHQFELLMNESLTDNEVVLLVRQIRDLVKMIAKAQVVIDEATGG
jgi:hypothetical protein